MGRTALLLLALALALVSCAAPPQGGAARSAAALEVTAEPSPAAPQPETATPAPPATPEEPSGAATATPAGATAIATEAAAEAAEATVSPTEPLYLEPTAVPGAASPTPEPAEPTSAPAASTAAGATPVAGKTAASSEKSQRTTGRPVRLVIDSIELDRPLVPVGLDENRIPIVPDHDVGWYTLGAQPGQGENVVLWGHVLRFKRAPHIPAPFARLKEVKVGDRVTLFDEHGTAYRYVVTELVQATPDQVEYMLPRGREMVTMISCIGDKVIEDGTVEMTHRLITIAEPLE